MKTTLPIYNLKGQTVGDIALNPAVFAKPAKADLLHQVMVTVINNRRPVVAHTKDRGEVSGTNKKPWKQKGTGNARVGSARSPLWRGGGATFGPNSDRNFVNRLPQKMKHAAWRGILTDKVNTDGFIVIDSLEDLDGKTKTWIQAVDLLTKVNPALTKKTLVIDAGKTELADRAIRNLANTRFVGLESLNLYDLMRFPAIVATKSAIEALTARLTSPAKAEAAV